MAILDVSEVISDPLFTSLITLIRRTESFDDNGNPVFTDSARVAVKAVVTADGKPQVRGADEYHRSGAINVRILLADIPKDFGTGYDAVKYRGRYFVITETVDYSQFGRGFIRLTCIPEEISDGSYRFSAGGDSEAFGRTCNCRSDR